MRQRDELEAGRAQTVEELGELENRLRNAQQGQTVRRANPPRPAAIAAAAEAARGVEVEARLAVRTAEERANAVRGRADSLRRAAAAEREARVRAERARAAREHAAAVAAAVAESGRQVAARLAEVVGGGVADPRRAGRRAPAAAGRDGRGARGGRHAERPDRRAHRVAAPRRGRPRRRRRCASSSSSSTCSSSSAWRPTIWSPSTGRRCRCRRRNWRWPNTSRPASAASRSPRRRRCRSTGPPRNAAPNGPNGNWPSWAGSIPLALEEFAALEERYNFLSTQLEDVKGARKDLLDVVADVDARILQVFAEAYADVEREFGEVFATLFPGGEGRLLLTDPDDMLTTGIEVEARPPGKKVKRLSLLSGGEKSLTAVAMLVAIFRARPSPFYVMDEVEAALDDVNLRRLIGLFEQLRDKSQLIVITHQKPTMEIADALYGVTMQGDGITTVISQRMRGQELVSHHRW